MDHLVDPVGGRNGGVPEEIRDGRGEPRQLLWQSTTVPNVTAKILGSNSKINNTKATMKALKILMPPLKKEPKKREPDNAGVSAATATATATE